VYFRREILLIHRNIGLYFIPISATLSYFSLKLYGIYARIYARRSPLKPGYGSWQNHGQHFSKLISSQKFLILKITIVSRRIVVFSLLIYRSAPNTRVTEMTVTSNATMQTI